MTVQETLLSREQRLRTALDKAGIGIWEWDMISDQVTWDDQQFELFGLPKTAETVALTSITDVIHPDDREQLAETAKAVLEGGATSLVSDSEPCA